MEPHWVSGTGKITPYIPQKALLGTLSVGSELMARNKEQQMGFWPLIAWLKPHIHSCVHPGPSRRLLLQGLLPV